MCQRRANNYAQGLAGIHGEPFVQFPALRCESHQHIVPLSLWHKARIIFVIELLKDGEVDVFAPFAGVRKNYLKKVMQR